MSFSQTNQQHLIQPTDKSLSFEEPEDLEAPSLYSKRVSFDQTLLDQPAAFSTPKPIEQGLSSVEERTDSTLEITDEQILEQQTLKEGEEQPKESDEELSRDIRHALSISRTDLSNRELQSSSVTGLPSQEEVLEQLETFNVATQLSNHSSNDRDSVTSGGSTSSLQRHTNGMGDSQSKGSERNVPKNIMSEEPAEMMQNRKKVSQSEVTGNCRPWSDHVYYKLFLDTEGRNATLMVLKCEISYVDVFTDDEHSLYKSRFIGGKSDGVAQMFVFDLMKANWEEKIPKSQAIELNVDIVMSSSPIHFCSETLLNLIQLEKTYLKHRNFDGQLNVMIRFAHGYGWDIKDDTIRARVHTGLRNLFREGVNLEVMSADIIMEELRVDGILATDDDRIKHYVGKRHSWSGQPIKSPKFHGSARGAEAQQMPPNNETSRTRHLSTSSSSSEEDFECLSEDDMYHVFLLDKLDQILANQYPSKRPGKSRTSGGKQQQQPKPSRNKFW